MSTFNEADVNRRHGRFDFKTHTPPGITLNPAGGGAPRFATARDLFDAELGDAGIVAAEATTKTEARRLLRNRKGEPDGAVRKVDVYAGWDDRIDVAGPADGRPLGIQIHTGMPRLHVSSGKAVIRADSSWGNSIDVGPGAEAVIVADPRSKVTVEVGAGGKATLISTATENRFRVHGDGDIQVQYGPGAEPEPYVRPVFEGF
jgi:hypothetical protein